MHRTPLLALVVIAASALAACESSSVVTPRAAGDASLDRSSGRSSSCTVNVGATTRPLPAVHEVARELNEAFANPQSSVNCGIVRSIDARFTTLVSALDRADGEQKLDAACGIAGSLVSQLEALVSSGALNPTVTHPPQAGPNVVENMDFIRSQFCANAGHPSDVPTT
jgi:hypothetical protein